MISVIVLMCCAAGMSWWSLNHQRDRRFCVSWTIVCTMFLGAFSLFPSHAAEKHQGSQLVNSTGVEMSEDDWTAVSLSRLGRLLKAQKAGKDGTRGEETKFANWEK